MYGRGGGGGGGDGGAHDGHGGDVGEAESLPEGLVELHDLGEVEGGDLVDEGGDGGAEAALAGVGAGDRRHKVLLCDGCSRRVPPGMRDPRDSPLVRGKKCKGTAPLLCEEGRSRL